AAADALKRLVQPGTTAERQAAAQALGNLINVLAQRETKYQLEARLDKLEETIRHTCEAVVPVAVLGLSDRDATVRRFAVDAIDQAALAILDLITIPGPGTLHFPPEGRAPTAEE